MMKKIMCLGFAGLLSAVSPFTFAETAISTDPMQSAISAPSPQTMSAEQQLAYTAQNKNETDEKRAEALRSLARYPNQNSLVAVARGLKDPNPRVREAAIIGSELYQFTHRWRMVSPLLTDTNATVRMTATSNLLRDFHTMDIKQKQQIQAQYHETVEYLNTQKDPASELLLADIYRWHGDWTKADTHYQQLIKSTPNKSEVWLNLSDNYRAQQKDNEALRVLEEGIRQLPNEASLYYSKALTQVRLNQKEGAASAIQTAATLAENNSYYWYLNGVLQETINREVAIESFEKAYLLSGSPEQLYAVCDIYVRYGNTKAEACLKELAKVAPEYVIEQLKEKSI